MLSFLNAERELQEYKMPSLVIRCPICGKTPRYALPSLRRIARDSESKAILNDGEPVMEMAYRCRGGDVFYHAQGQSNNLPKASKKLIEQVLEEIAKKKEKENA
jgi:hypothetical protein